MKLTDICILGPYVKRGITGQLQGYTAELTLDNGRGALLARVRADDRATAMKLARTKRRELLARLKEDHGTH
jgi:hypothetical protein